MIREMFEENGFLEEIDEEMLDSEFKVIEEFCKSRNKEYDSLTQIMIDYILESTDENYTAKYAITRIRNGMFPGYEALPIRYFFAGNTHNLYFEVGKYGSKEPVGDFIFSFKQESLEFEYMSYNPNPNIDCTKSIDYLKDMCNIVLDGVVIDGSENFEVVEFVQDKRTYFISYDTWWFCSCKLSKDPVLVAFQTYKTRSSEYVQEIKNNHELLDALVKSRKVYNRCFVARTGIPYYLDQLVNDTSSRVRIEVVQHGDYKYCYLLADDEDARVQEAISKRLQELVEETNLIN